MQIHERQRPIDFAEITRRLTPHGTVRHNEFILQFWRDPYELTLFPDGRAIIKGTTDTGDRAKSVCAVCGVVGQLAVGSWQLAVGSWLLAVGRA